VHLDGSLQGGSLASDRPALRQRIVLLGPPASGKGTQGELIAKRFGIVPTSSGALLREESRRGTELGRRADDYTEKGQLVPDELILKLVEGWLEQQGERFVLDGFPRTLPQGQALEELLQARGSRLDVVFLFRVSEEEIGRRVLNRVTCDECGEIFRLGQQVQTVEDRCPACGGRLSRRKDDTLEVLSARMEEYHVKTEPLVAFYRQRGILRELDGDVSPEAVFEEISQVLEHA